MTITSHDNVPTTALDGAVKDYSRDKVYVLTAVFLAVLTIIEVFTYAAPDFPIWADELLIPVLMILMAVKFFTILYIFMHLKFEEPLFRWLVGVAILILGIFFALTFFDYAFH